MEKNIFSTFGGLVLFQDVVEVAEELFLVDPPLIPVQDDRVHLLTHCLNTLTESLTDCWLG